MKDVKKKDAVNTVLDKLDNIADSMEKVLSKLDKIEKAVKDAQD